MSQFEDCFSKYDTLISKLDADNGAFIVKSLNDNICSTLLAVFYFYLSIPLSLAISLSFYPFLFLTRTLHLHLSFFLFAF